MYLGFAAFGVCMAGIEHGAGTGSRGIQRGAIEEEQGSPRKTFLARQGEVKRDIQTYLASISQDGSPCRV